MDLEAQFTEIIKAHEGIIFKISAFYANDADDRADLFQEIVYQLWRSFGAFQGRSKPGTWIYRVALNTSITHLRKSKRSPATMPISAETLQLPDQPDDGTEERLRMLHTQVQKLNLLEKGIVLLYLEGKSYKEIAAITGITTSNVATKLSRIREKLKASLIKTT